MQATRGTSGTRDSAPSTAQYLPSRMKREQIQLANRETLRAVIPGNRMQFSLEKKCDGGYRKGNRVSRMNCFRMAKSSFQNRVNRYFLSLLLLAASLAGLAAAAAVAQAPSPSQLDAITVEGTVRNSAGEPVMGASVVLEEKGGTRRLETKTDAEGKFSFTVRHAGMYTATVEKAGFGKCVTDPMPLLSAGQKKQLDLRLQTATPAQPSSSSAAASSGAMEFKDEPSFTVAGVTDWSGAGGHGSDTSLRTSEALARETLALKSSGPADPSHGAASRQRDGITKPRSWKTSCAPRWPLIHAASRQITSWARFVCFPEIIAKPSHF